MTSAFKHPARTPIVRSKVVTLDSGFPPPNLVAVADKRYINRYHYDAVGDCWYLIVDAQVVGGINHWVTRLVDSEDGRPIGHLKKHTLDIWADRFSDRPFDVSRIGSLGSLFDWFSHLCEESNVAPSRVAELYDGYLARLNYCSSFEALVRLGLRQP